MGREYKTGSKGNKIEICELDLSGSGQGPVTRSSEHVNLSTSYIKRAKFIYLLRNYKLSKKNLLYDLIWLFGDGTHMYPKSVTRK